MASGLGGAAISLDAVRPDGLQSLPPRLRRVPEWWNWQTRQLEGLVPVIRGAGSSPVSGTMQRARGGATGRGSAGIDGPAALARRWPLRRWDRSGLPGNGRRPVARVTTRSRGGAVR